MIIINLRDFDISKIESNIVKSYNDEYEIKTTYNLNGKSENFLIRISGKKINNNMSNTNFKLSLEEQNQFAQIKDFYSSKLMDTIKDHVSKFYTNHKFECEIKSNNCEKERFYMKSFLGINDKIDISKSYDVLIELCLRFHVNKPDNIKIYPYYKPIFIKEINYTRDDFKNSYDVFTIKDEYNSDKKLSI